MLNRLDSKFNSVFSLDFFSWTYIEKSEAIVFFNTLYIHQICYLSRSIEDSLGVEILGRSSGDQINDDDDDVLDETDRFA